MSQLITITTQEPPEAPPTVTHYQEIAAEVMKALDQLAAIIPKVGEAEASGRKIARSRLGVSEVFCSTVIAAVEQLPELAASKKLDPVAGRDKLQYLEAFRPLYDKLFSVTRRLNFTLMFTKDDLAFASLQTYRIAKQHASDGSPEMTAHVANMKRDLGKRTPTKAEREQQKADKLKAAVDEELNKRRVQEALAQQQKKEVPKAA